MPCWCWVLAALLVLGLGWALYGRLADRRESHYSRKVVAEAQVRSLYDTTFRSIRGDATSISAFRGKVLLIVNVASRCGYTPQYKGLEALYREHKDAGLVVIGFPCNQFLRQEPGTNAEVQTFCQVNYGVTFPLSEKIEVSGPNKHPLYAYLTGPGAAFPGRIAWNFTKFVVDRRGRVVARFSPRVDPTSPDLTEAVRKALAGSGGDAG